MIKAREWMRSILFALIMALATSGSVALVGTFARNGLTAHFFMQWWLSFRIAYFVVVFCILVFAPPIQRLANRIIK